MVPINKNETIVSIVCLAYNHEKFIAKTLEGFVNQKTDFKFEVLVHDDASTDNTAAVIRKYAADYPEIIKPIYQTENQYKKKIGIIKTFIVPILTGRYMTWCEGDDYWTDLYKLQEQVDALENNPGCAACFTKVQKIGFDESLRDDYFPQRPMQTGTINQNDYYGYTLSNGFPWQLSGFMIKRSIYEDYLLNEPEYRKYFEVGDLPLFLFAGLKGNIYYIDKVMSYYRTGNADSFIGSSNSINNKKEKAQYFLRKAEAYRKFDIYTNFQYHELVEKAVNSALLASYRRSHDLKKLKEKTFRTVYDTLSIKEKIKQHIFYYFPWSENLYYSIKTKISSKKRG